MNMAYDIYGRTEPSRIYLAKPGKRILGELNGIKENTCNIDVNLNNTDTLSFEVDRIVDGELSNWYDRIQQHYELYVAGVGWFKINEPPETSYDGNIETKSVNAESLEIELQQYDLVGFKINCGTEDSWEMMAIDNIYEDEDGYKLPRESVYFYRETKSIEDLISTFSQTEGTLENLQSLLYQYPVVLDSWRVNIDLDTFDAAIQHHIDDMKTEGRDTEVLEAQLAIQNKTQDFAKKLCKVYFGILKYVTITVDASNGDAGDLSISEILSRFLQNRHELSFLWLVLNEHGWSVGYVDEYVDTSTPKKLSDTIGKFEVTSQDIYSFLTQEVANYYRCIFVFDTENYLVSAYKIENVGNDTNIFLSFQNVQNSIVQSSDKKIYTVYHVSNNEELNLREVNFGEDSIEDISYFMNEEHFSRSLIDKYNNWRSERSSKRKEYCELSKKYRDQNDVVSEIYYRVPTDLVDVSQYTTFTDEELLNERSGCEAQLKGYESLYVDDTGAFDLTALQASSDWKTYKIIKEIVIPNIDIELYNRSLTDKKDYLDFNENYKYDFDIYGDSYGVAELITCRDTLKNNMETLADRGYDTSGEPGDEYHAKQHALYIKYKAGYDSCVRVLEQRQKEYDDASAILDSIQNQRLDLKALVSKDQFGFTQEELGLLDKYYIHTDYVNDNIVITSLDGNETLIDKANELYKDAEEQLYSDSHPQWNWTTTQDNLLAMPEFKEWHEDLSIGNFIRISIREDYQVKLRITTISFNPFMIETNIGITFSNMIQYKSKRNDFACLLGIANPSSKNQIVATISNGNGGSGSTNATFNIDANLVRKLINNSAFNGYMNGIVSDSVAATSGVLDYLVAQKIDAIEINVNKIVGDEADFNTLFSKYIDADYINSRVIISDTGEFKEINAYLANLKQALIGTSSTETGIVFNLSAANAKIDEAWITELIAKKISVGDLIAHTSTSEQIVLISSESGNPTIAFKDSTQQFFDSEGNVRVQIGQDGFGDFNFIVRGADGSTALFDSNGIRKEGIPNNTIINDMITDNTIEKQKLGFEIIEPNEYGGIDISKIYNGDGGKFGVEYSSFKENTSSTLTQLDQKIDDSLVYHIEITSSNGNIFKNGQIETTLYCHVYKSNEDITDTINASAFHWIKKNNDGSLDEVWNTKHFGGTKEVVITSSDISVRSTFECTVDGIPPGN